MDNCLEHFDKVYEVEKIINCKFYKNKKYYLIKWLCYPISHLGTKIKHKTFE